MIEPRVWAVDVVEEPLLLCRVDHLVLPAVPHIEDLLEADYVILGHLFLYE